jgi:hypothetical protein
VEAREEGGDARRGEKRKKEIDHEGLFIYVLKEMVVTSLRV